MSSKKTLYPQETGWYWFRGLVRAGTDHEREVLYPVEFRGPIASGGLVGVMKGAFLFEYEPLDGEFRRAPIPWETGQPP